MARRAQLAVVAHIRHVYTDYDRLLKVTSFHEARSIVEEPTLAKLVAWRGDDENGKTVLEDVFREVIVISDDDEDSDADEGENVPPTNNRELSVEYVSSQARTVELPTGMVTYTNPASRECLRELSEDEAPQGFHVIPEVPKKNKIDRRGFSRYEAWDRAINRYRNVTNGADQNRFHGGSTDRQRPFYSTRQPPYGSVNVSTEPRHQVVSSQTASAAPPNLMRDHHVSAEKVPTLPLIGSSYGNWAQKESSCNILTSHALQKVHPMPPLPGPSRQRNPDVVQLPDILPLKRAAPPLRNGHISLRQYDSSAPILLNDPQGFRDGNEAQFGHQPRTMASSHNKGSDAQDRALPSIENPSSPKEIRRPGSGRLDHLSKRISGGLSIRSVTPQRLPHQESSQQDIGERHDDGQFPKRRRVAYHGSIPGNSHPGIAPGGVDCAVSTIHKEPPGGKRYIPCGYVPSGHPSQDDSHVRRKYVTPADQHFAGRWPERAQNHSVHAAHVNTNPSIPVDERRIDDRVGGHPTHHHSSITLDDKSTLPVLNSSDTRVPRTYHGDNNHGVDGLRSLHMPGPRILSWRNQDNERLMPSQDVSQRRNFYADDFVRPVGLHEPRPLEYTMQRPHIQAQRATEIIPHTPGARVYDGQHNREEPVDTRPSIAYRQPWLDYRAAPHSHEYAILDDRDRWNMRDSRLFESSFVPRHYEQRHEGFLDSTRYDYSIKILDTWTSPFLFFPSSLPFYFTVSYKGNIRANVSLELHQSSPNMDRHRIATNLVT